MQELLAREARGDERARLAIEMFVRRAAAGIAAAATTLARIDAVVFTGGIGEHAASVRARICERLRLGEPDQHVREVDGDEIRGTAAGSVIIRVAAREDVVIANEVATLIQE